MWKIEIITNNKNIVYIAKTKLYGWSIAKWKLKNIYFFI